MKSTSLKKILALLITFSLSMSTLPTYASFENKDNEQEVLSGESQTPEPVNEELIADIENVEYPIETQNPALVENEDEDEVENKSDKILAEQDDVESSEKPYEYVTYDELPRNMNDGIALVDAYSDPKSLYKLDMLESNRYNPKVSGDVSISNVSGDVNYTYNLASIPGKNGSVMDLTLEYNQSKSSFVYTSTDRTDAKDYYSEPYLIYESDGNIGAGWEFSGLKRVYSGSYKLRDGRIVRNAYSYDYNYFSIGNNQINYIDGTVEGLTSDGYLAYTEDKYGNRISYTYETGDDGSCIPSVRLKKITDGENRSINISYYKNYILVTKPDNSMIKINTSYVTANHVGQMTGFDMSFDGKVVTSIEDVTDGYPIADFTYEPKEIRYIIGPGGYDIQIDDQAVYMPMTYANTEYSGIHQMDYTVVSNKDSDPYLYAPSSRTWHIATDKYYTGDDKTAPKTSYSYEYENERDLITTEVTDNNKVTKTKMGEIEYSQEVYTRNGTNDILKSKVLNTFNSHHSERPKTSVTTVYNSAGNTITTETNNEYDYYGKITSSVQKVEGVTKSTTKNTYYTDSYKSLETSTVTKSDGSLIKTEYTVNSLGDVSVEKAYDKDNAILKNKSYIYTDNNLTQETIHNGYSLAMLERKRYEYTGPYLTREYAVDSSNNVISEVKYEYNTDTGQVIKTSNLRTSEEIEYDALGRVTKEKHADGTYKQISYDSGERAVSVRNENNYINKYYYDSSANLTNISEINNSNTLSDLRNITYDKMGNAITVKDALNNQTEITYDAFGRQTSVKAPTTANTQKAKYYEVFLEGNTKYSVYLTMNETGRINISYYDVFGRLVKTAMVKNYYSFDESDFDNITQMPSNAELVITSRYVYNEWDRVIEQYDGENRPTYYTYDVLGNVINMKQGIDEEDTKQISIDYQYDKAGRLIKTTQGTHITSYLYDTAGRLIQETDPMGYTENYTYDTAGNIMTAKDKNGDTTANTYNNRGLLLRTSKNGEYINYTYSNTGALLTSKDKNGTISYQYNYDGTLYKKTYPDGKSITYNSYNANKALTSMTDYLGNTTQYGYDKRGNIISISEKYADAQTTAVTRYSYFTDGSLNQIIYPLSSSMKTRYSYDYAGRVMLVVNSLTSSTNYSQHNYTYDNSGNITKKVDNIQGASKTSTYMYDNLNRLLKETIGGSWNSYHYDEYNNLISSVGWEDTYYFYDANNRLTSIEDYGAKKETATGTKFDDWTTYLTYDKNGNLKLMGTDACTEPYEPSNYKSYAYNEWGQLIEFNDSFGETASYTYYSDGLRASKTIGDNTTKYYYDGDNVINETLNNNNYATNVMGVNGYVSRRQNGTTGYLFKDAHGDVLSIYTSTSNKVADYTYDAWGEIRTQNESSSFENNPLRYYGQYYDYESNMTYLRARYYDSSIRRFISEDPAKDGSNWYAYCGNNPVMMFDPSGLAIYVPENQSIIIDYLNILTRDELYIDSNGYVKIKNYGMNTDDRSAGTELIYQLINNSNICTIKVSNKNDTTYADIDLASMSGVGTDTTINFIADYEKQDKVFVYDKNANVVEQKQPVQIALAHELIHLLRGMKGSRKKAGMGTNKMPGANNEYWRQEEFDTVGIDHIRDDGSYADAANWYFTENTIRREQGFYWRAKYA